jgi:hypothetical protein
MGLTDRKGKYRGKVEKRSREQLRQAKAASRRRIGQPRLTAKQKQRKARKDAALRVLGLVWASC